MLRLASSQGDGTDYKQMMLDMGLSLNAEGLDMVDWILTDEDTKSRLREGADENWVWNLVSAQATQPGEANPPTTPDQLPSNTPEARPQPSAASSTLESPSQGSAWSFEQQYRESQARQRSDAFSFDDLSGSSW